MVVLKELVCGNNMQNQQLNFQQDHIDVYEDVMYKNFLVLPLCFDLQKKKKEIRALVTCAIST
jgi:hypothetical protein